MSIGPRITRGGAAMEDVPATRLDVLIQRRDGTTANLELLPSELQNSESYPRQTREDLLHDDSHL